MSAPRPAISRTTSLAGAAVFGALAGVVTFSVQIPYPVPGFTFLAIDPAELVDALAFLLFGPAVGLLTAIVHWIVLNFLPSASPLFGPLLKLFAVGSMLLGMWVGQGINMRILRRKGGRTAFFGLMLVFGLVVRVLVMTPVNYVFLIFVFAPGVGESLSYLSYYLGGLAIYNGIHTIFSAIVPFAVVSALLRAAPHLGVRTWFSRTSPFGRLNSQE